MPKIKSHYEDTILYNVHNCSVTSMRKKRGGGVVLCHVVGKKHSDTGGSNPELPRYEAPPR